MKIAKFTILQHEPVFFPIWLEYYSKFFDSKDLFVLHHILPDSDDPWQKENKRVWDYEYHQLELKYRFNSVPVRNDLSFDHEWLRSVVCGFQQQLLTSYDAVLFTEIDEIIAPNPDSKYGYDLAAYMQEKLEQKPIWVCNGYEVVHNYDEEPAMNLQNPPLMEQRKYWYWNKMYSKPLLSRVPLGWCAGFHACHQIPIPYLQADPDLLMLHLHKMDYPVCLERNVHNSRRKWSNADGVFGFQNRLTTEKKLKQWWYNHIDMHSQRAEFSEMPVCIKKIL